MGIYNNIHLHQPQLKTTVPNSNHKNSILTATTSTLLNTSHSELQHLSIDIVFFIYLTVFKWKIAFKRNLAPYQHSNLILTLLNMPEIKVVLYVVQLFPRVFTNRCMSVCYQSSNQQTTSQEICHAILESKELHSWTTTCNIPLQKIKWSILLHPEQDTLDN